jgi:hypothetical protein
VGLGMIDKIRECVSDVLAIADGPHPRVFDLARERIERLLRECNAQLGDDNFSLAQEIRDQLGKAFNGHRGGGAAQFLDDVIGWLDEHYLGR